MELEYKHVKFDYGWLGALDSRIFDERIVGCIGDDGGQARVHHVASHAALLARLLKVCEL